MNCINARNAASTPSPLTAEMTNGVVFATRVRLATCRSMSGALSASALLSATISGFFASS